MRELDWEQVSGRFTVAGLHMLAGIDSLWAYEAFSRGEVWFGISWVVAALVAFSFGMERHVRSANEAYVFGMNSGPNIRAVNSKDGE